MQPHGHYHLCTGIPPHWIIFPSLTGPATHPAMISFPCSRLHSHPLMLGRLLVWSGSLSGGSVSFTQLCSCLCVRVYICETLTSCSYTQVCWVKAWSVRSLTHWIMYLGTSFSHFISILDQLQKHCGASSLNGFEMSLLRRQRPPLSLWQVSRKIVSAPAPLSAWVAHLPVRKR